MTDPTPQHGVWQTRAPHGQSVWPPMWDIRTGQPVWDTSGTYDCAAVPEPRRPWWRRITARLRRTR